MGKMYKAISVCVIMILIAACGPSTSQVVVLNRDDYASQIDPARYPQYKGKIIMLNSIVENSKNTSNFAYYNPEKTFGHSLFYSTPGRNLPQPLASYLWYVLQKGFGSAGIKIVADETSFDAEMTITINSITDEEVKFDVLTIGNNSLKTQKSYVTTMPKAPSLESPVLEKRAYKMHDKMIEAILDDPDMQKVIAPGKS